MINKNYYDSVPDYYHKYFDLVEQDDLLAELERSKHITQFIYNFVNDKNANYTYDEGKWTISEVLRHIIDCERIFAYRALRLSRFDSTELTEFDENMYASRISVIAQDLDEMKEEYVHIRESTIYLYKNMNLEMLDFRSKINNNYWSARTIGYATIGHNLHHCNILRNRYLGK